MIYLDTTSYTNKPKTQTWSIKIEGHNCLFTLILFFSDENYKKEMFSIRFSGKKNDPAKKLGSMYSKHHLFHQ